MWGRGTVLGGRYTLTERLGGGAMGEVWRANDTVLERRVAVKILLPSLLDDPAFAERFRREAKVLASLDHPGIVRVHDYGEDDAEPPVAWIVMELIDGLPLSDVLRREGPMPEARALDIVAQTLDALHAAHRGGVVHRDVKPSNLMVRDDGRVTVTDFGIARSAVDSTITASHAVIGSARYMAPEQARGDGAGPRSDVYAIGVMCHELLVGQPPFIDDAVYKVLLRHIEEPAPALPGTFTAPVRALVARALEKDPDDRYADAAAMAAAARQARDALTERARAGTGQAAAGQAGTDRPGSTREDSRPPVSATHRADAGDDTPRTGQPADDAATGDPVDDDPSGGEQAGGEQAGGEQVGGAPKSVPGPVPSDPCAGDAASRGTAPEGPASEPAPPADSAHPESAPLDSPPLEAAPQDSAPPAPEQAPAAGPGPTGGRRWRGRALAVALLVLGVVAGAATTAFLVRDEGGARHAASPDASARPGTATDAGQEPPAAPAASGPPATAATTPPGQGTPSAAAPPGSPGAPGTGPAPSTGAGTAPAAGPTGGSDTAPKGSVPQGCGGASWGAITNVGDGQRLGLVADGPTRGTAVTMGGHTQYGWVRTAGTWDSFRSCNAQGPALGQPYGNASRPELATGFGHSTSWTLDSAPTRGAVYIKDYLGQRCLTSHGAGRAPTVEACTGAKSQQWRVP